MKIVKIVLIVCVGLITLWYGLIMLASESGEVVVLHSQDASGANKTTRLWVVDYQGYPYLRSGSPESGWFKRIHKTNRVIVERNGNQQSYQPSEAPELRDAVNKLVADKYGWADKIIGFFLPRDDAIPIRLAPIRPRS